VPCHHWYIVKTRMPHLQSRRVVHEWSSTLSTVLGIVGSIDDVTLRLEGETGIIAQAPCGHESVESKIATGPQELPKSPRPEILLQCCGSAAALYLRTVLCSAKKSLQVL